MTKLAKLLRPDPVSIDSARVLELGELWQQAMRWGLPTLFTHAAERGHPIRFSGGITRSVGKSELQTSHKTFGTPEQALMHAIAEAELWGLPELDT